MDDCILKVEGLTKRYGIRAESRVTALKELSFSLERGHIYGLVGNNGAGKTTLLRILCGLTLPDAGSLSLFGSTNERELREARKRLGVLIEAPNYYEEMSVIQNLRAQALLLPRAEREEPEALCALLGIDGRVARRRIRKCSLGERQRYGLASALLSRPELLLLDEPLNGLDPNGVMELRELLLSLNQERGITLLLSSHLLAELHKVATDYIFLRRGELAECVSAEELDRRIEEQGLRDVESYFVALNREGSPWADR